MSSVPGGIDGLEAVFDDASLVADAGLLLAGTLMQRLGLEALLDATVRPSGAGRGSGRKVLSLVASMLVGGCCIDDAQRLRSGSAAAVLPFAPLAPSTLGTFLRSFTFGHVRQLDKALESAQMRAWSVGAAPDAAEMTVDLDSTVCEVCGRAKHGAAYGHTKVLGYHPLVAVRSDTGEVLHSRMRSGSSQRFNERFARETLAKVRRLAADAAVTVRADAGFFSYDMIAAIGAHGASYSITIPHNAKVKAAAAAIDEAASKAGPLWSQPCHPTTVAIPGSTLDSDAWASHRRHGPRTASAAGTGTRPRHRRGHHQKPAPHRAGPPRQPQRPTQTAPATGPGRTPGQIVGRPQRPAQRRPTPPATNPHQPRTPMRRTSPSALSITSRAGSATVMPGCQSVPGPSVPKSAGASRSDIQRVAE